MPLPTITEIVDTLPPPPPRTARARVNGQEVDVASAQYVAWVQMLAQLKSAQALGVIANANVSTRGLTLEGF